VDPAYLAAHVEEDCQHWYFRGRVTVISAALRRVLPPRRLRLVDIGCGTGAILRVLADFGEAIGVEANDALLEVARASGLDARKGMLPHDLPIAPGWADVVLLLDVIEHLDDDLGALRRVSSVLAAGGVLVLTVPAYPWLWSGHDDLLGHRRRYFAPGLRRLVERAGYRVERLTHFNTVLFPLIAGRRLYKQWLGDDRHDLQRTGRTLNGVLEGLFSLERHLVPAVTLPFGTSLFLVARRP
jgi:SAM-dependent methyltransferase